MFAGRFRLGGNLGVVVEGDAEGKQIGTWVVFCPTNATKVDPSINPTASWQSQFLGLGFEHQLQPQASSTLLPS